MGDLNLFFLRNQQTACIPYMKMVATQKNYLLYTLAAACIPYMKMVATQKNYLLYTLAE